MGLLRPWQLSFLAHFLLVFAFVLVTRIRIPVTETIEIPVVVEPPKEAQNLTKVQEKPKVVLKSVNEPVPSDKPAREVFGASRRSHTDASVSEGEAVEAKKGTTLAKSTDREVLLDSDPDSLPTPTEEYLVSEMPSVLSEVRPEYPPQAREKRLTGAVVMDILIDEAGKVRQVSFVEGPEIFKAVAIEAMGKFKFRPAQVDGKPVAVRIRYTLRFELEY